MVSFTNPLNYHLKTHLESFKRIQTYILIHKKNCTEFDAVFFDMLNG